MPDAMTYKEAAEFLCVEYETVRKLVSNGRLHSIKVPRSKEKRISTAELMKRKMEAESGQVTRTVQLQQTEMKSPTMVRHEEFRSTIEAVDKPIIELMDRVNEQIDKLRELVQFLITTRYNALAPALAQLADRPISEDELTLQQQRQFVETR